MDAQEFRKHGHDLVNWIADYLEGDSDQPILAQVEPGEIRKQLPSHAPDSPEAMTDILDDFHKIIMPGITHWNLPRFFAYFPANNSGPSVLAELLSAALGVNGMVWESCPAATELEQVVMDWLRQLVGLPEEFAGVIQDTASTATLCSLLCAREQSTDWNFNREGGHSNPQLRIYTSAEAHSSVEKGAKIAGFGKRNVVHIAVDQNLAMEPGDLLARIEADENKGLVPCCISATAGTTSSTAMDPIKAIAQIAAQKSIWLHLDAALAGSAAILPEKRHLFEGMDQVDSMVFNPHKWLFTNFDCSAYFTRHPQVLTRTFSIMPEYLKTARDDQAINYRDWGVALGRRFRALKLWFVLRHYGADGLRQRLRDHLIIAQEFASWIDDSPVFERLAQVPMQTVCFRYNPARGAERALSEEKLRALNESLLNSVNKAGKIFITHTTLAGKYCLRLSIGQRKTRLEHVRQAWQEIGDHASRCGMD